jgi:hypothetical protein
LPFRGGRLRYLTASCAGGSEKPPAHAYDFIQGRWAIEMPVGKPDGEPYILLKEIEAELK